MPGAAVMTLTECDEDDDERAAALPVQWMAQAALPLDACEAAYRAALADAGAGGDAACRAVVLALRSIWESGVGFQQLPRWLGRVDRVRALVPSPAAEAAMLVFGLNATVLWGGVDLRRILAVAEAIDPLIDLSGQPDLRLLAAAAQAPARALCGDLPAAREQIRDLRCLLDDPRVSETARLCFCAAGAFVFAVGGDTGTFWADDLRRLLEPPAGGGVWPLHVQLTGLAHLLMAQGARGDAIACGRIAEVLRSLVIPAGRLFHWGYLHHALGMAALLAGRPDDARVHARISARRARQAGSATAELLACLLLARACALLGRAADADAASAVADAHGQVMGLDPSALAAWSDRSRVAPAAAQTDPRVEVTCLGGFAVSVAGRPLVARDWHGQRAARVLMALIALGGTDVPVEPLCDALWPDADGSQAHQNLKVALWRLRRTVCRDRALASDWLTLCRGRVSIDLGQCRVDALAFDAATTTAPGSASQAWQVLQTYAGPFLPGEESVAVVAACRERLRRRFVQWCIEGTRLALDEPGPASPQWLLWLERATEGACPDERLFEQRMAWYLRSGRPADALAIYLTAEQTLQREAQRPPGPALRSLRQRAARLLLGPGEAETGLAGVP